MKKIYAILFVALFSFATNHNAFSAYEVSSTSDPAWTAWPTLTAALATVGVGETGVVQIRITASDAAFPATTIVQFPVTVTSLKIFPWDGGAVPAVYTLTYAGTASAITLSGADNVTIDGRWEAKDNVGNINHLALTCTSPAGTVRGVTINNGALINLIRNVDISVPVVVTAITGGRPVNIVTGTLAQGVNNDNTIKYCNISGGDRGLQTAGTPTFVETLNTTFYGNRIKNNALFGIFLASDAINCTVDSNDIYDDVPVYHGGTLAFCDAIRNQAHGNILIQRNIIRDYKVHASRTTALQLSAFLNIPIRGTGTVPNPITNVTVQNNLVSFTQDNLFLNFLLGIWISTTSTAGSALDYNAKVYNNTAIFAGAGSATELSYALVFTVVDGLSANGPSTATYYNNVALNVRSGGIQHVGMDFEVAPGVATVSDYNTAYADAPTPAGDAGGPVYFNAVDATLGYNNAFTWRDTNCVTGNEQNTAFSPVNYGINFKITAAEENYGELNGLVSAGIPTKDIFGATKAPLYPYRGAVEGPILKELTITAGLDERQGPENSDMLVALYDGCTFVDYAHGYITDANGSPKYLFATAIDNGTPYTLRFITETHLESWSSGTVTFASGIGSYAFTSDASIYGNNGTSSGEFYPADVNQDGIVDGGDVSAVDNAAAVGFFGCRITTYDELGNVIHADINYDGTIDGSDLSIVDNNSAFSWLVAAPCSPAPGDNIMQDKRLRNIQKNTERVKLPVDRKSNFNSNIAN